MGRQHQGMDRSEVRQVPEGSGKQGKMEETGCEITCWCPDDPRGYGIDADVVDGQYDSTCMKYRIENGQQFPEVLHLT